MHIRALGLPINPQNSQIDAVHKIIKLEAQRLCGDSVERRDEASALRVNVGVGVYDHVVALEGDAYGVVRVRPRRHRNCFIVVAAASLKVKVVIRIVRPPANALALEITAR